MKSGLGDRNNRLGITGLLDDRRVSMKSGLGDRNNLATLLVQQDRGGRCLNEVRSWRPEQWSSHDRVYGCLAVSMKSGLGDRNNRGVRAVEG